VGTAVSPSPGPLAVGLAAGLAVLATALVSALLAVVSATGPCADAVVQPAPGRTAHTIPADYLALYRRAGGAWGVPWTVLAGIGAVETDHGRLRAPGVHAGVNAFGCCAGPMQFNLTDGPPSTWQRYATDGDGDGRLSPYTPADAIASAARYLRALLAANHDELEQAILGYNHSPAYVADVLARARAYAGRTQGELVESGVASSMSAACAAEAAGMPGGPADLRAARRLTAPRAYRPLPTWALAGSGSSVLIDARLYDDVTWIARRYRLRVTAAREAGHNTHGDGTAVDLIPADGVTEEAWDASAGRLARDLGWTPACGRSGTRPACPLVRAIQFVGYDGYPGHGSPRTCSTPCPAHLHVSWTSPCYGSRSLAAPCRSVTAFGPPRSL
jgi:hypothetical protein